MLLNVQNKKVALIVNKADILLHPVRMKIVRVLMTNSQNGLTPLEMAKMIQDVPQATLYRHIQKLTDAGIIKVWKEEKVRAVMEKRYIVNIEDASLHPDEWKRYTMEEKLDYYSYYQLALFNQYQTYLEKIEKQNVNDKATLAMLDVRLNEPVFEEFQQELTELMKKYHKMSEEDTNQDKKNRSIGITIIPDA